ncbi:SDR family NAD(P)-dependent oxidoreductase [Terriglobus sp.]|uniref:SDR family NAD(P)-dependent oxidoreductase n=1 Tax=Terriglobus sp. TaxID=1889013 RepID=UPI003B00DFC8
MSRLDGKVAVVTGASKGIGASIAEALGKNGAKVVVNYATSQDAADAVVRRIVQAGGRAVAVGADLSRPEQVGLLIEGAKAAFGERIDVLVNNAGTYEFRPIEQVTPEHFYKHFNLNVLGMLLTIRASLPLFPEAGGSIINIGSMLGKHASANASVHSASKGAVDSLTVALSKELGPRGIRVNSVNPGPIATEGAAGFEAFFAEMKAKTPLGRVGEPRDIAAVVAFFASDDSAWISGENVLVGGGVR